MNFTELLESISDKNWKGKTFRLDRVKFLLENLGNPEKNLEYIHVAGTNGKGSTSAMLASILKEAGYKTGLFTSPYIQVPNERIQINGENIPEEDLLAMIDLMKAIIKKMDDRPTEFELITVLALLYFDHKKCDIVVLEVGLGGRLDATNVIPVPEVAVITSIGLDHTEELGDTVEKIAAEKGGIIKEYGEVVLYQQEQSVIKVVEEICRKKKARLHVVDFSHLKIITSNLQGQRINFEDFENISLGLLGEYQVRNAAVALTAVEVLRNKGWIISDMSVVEGMRKVKWPGRFEVLHEKPYLIVDGAHNFNGVQALVRNLDKYFTGKKVNFVMGVLRDKDYDKMVDLILPYAKRIILVRPDSDRALSTQELTNVIRKKGFTNIIQEPLVSNAITQSLQLSEEEITIALGSLYMIGEIKDMF